MIEEIINFFHLLGTVVWIGGMFYMDLILIPSLSKIDPGESGKLMGIIAKKFTITAWSAMLVLIITGILKIPSDMYFDISDNYGIYLFIKHVLFIGAIMVGLVITLVFVPKLKANTPNPGEKPSEEFIYYTRKIEQLSKTNLILGIFILISASFLW
jgi:uncharacterized membrane protein